MRTLDVACIVGGLALLTPVPTLRAQSPAGSDPAAATVLIRLIGDLESEAPPDLVPVWERRVRESNVEIGTGSGFLITPVGHILTCAHVVLDSTETFVVDGRKVNVKLIVRRIEVTLPAGGTNDPSLREVRSYEATVLASDPELDLAVLSINGSMLPYLPLGDSDALEAGDAVTAIGYPFGRDVEIGRSADPASRVTPDPSVSRGNVSAFRTDDRGERRYLQTTAAVSVGSSGGPVLDADGYVAGIVSRMLVGRAAAAGSVPFAVAVNVAKTFLEARSLDTLLGVSRLYAGSLHAVTGKEMSVAFPHGLIDRSPVRARVEAGEGTGEGLVLRIDRVLSPWTPLRLAQALTAERAFEGLAPATAPVQRAIDAGGRRLLVGHVTGRVDSGQATRMEYAIVDLGSEKLVARYLGPADQVAFNASVVRASLKALEGVPLRTAARGAALPEAWAALGPGRSEPLAAIPMPAGWIVERAGPMWCQGLPAAADGASASPPGDFATALRVGWLRGVAIDASRAATACGTESASAPGAYERQIEWLGTRFVLVGRFIARGPGELLQLEAIAPIEQAGMLRSLFEKWMAQVGAPAGSHDTKTLGRAAPW